MTWLHKLARKLKRDTSGLALTEMALSMPFVLFGGMWGVELANYAITNMKVSQIALHIADNAARIGDTSTLQNRKIYESDIEDMFFGAFVQGGKKMNFFENGRAVLTSLEEFQQTDHCISSSGGCTPPGRTNGDQFIHWQRCLGKLNKTSTYGKELDVKPGGIGPSGREVLAISGRPVMFVQVWYQYQPLISGMFVGRPTIEAVGAYPVRTDRDLSKIYQRDPILPVPPARCSIYSNPFTYPNAGTPGAGASSSSGGGASSGGASGGGASGGGASGGGASGGGGGGKP